VSLLDPVLVSVVTAVVPLQVVDLEKVVMQFPSVIDTSVTGGGAGSSGVGAGGGGGSGGGAI
jgi:uncharacterized membrane protein YgcG